MQHLEKMKKKGKPKGQQKTVQLEDRSGGGGPCYSM